MPTASPCLQTMPVTFGCIGGCPPGSYGYSAVIAFGDYGIPCTVCFDDTGTVTSICVPTPIFPDDGEPVVIAFFKPGLTQTLWGGTIAGPGYNSFCLASITTVSMPMTSLPYQGD